MSPVFSLRKTLCYGLGILVVLGLCYLLFLFVCVLYWAWFNPSSTRFMAIRLAELQLVHPSAGLQQQWVPYARISIHLKRAIIAAEDAKYLHPRPRPVLIPNLQRIPSQRHGWC